LAKEHGLACGTSTNPNDGNTKLLLNTSDVVLSIARELRELCNVRNVFVPTVELAEVDLAAGEIIKAGRHGSIENLTIKLVIDGNLDLLHTSEDVKLGHVDRGQAVDLVRELDHIEVEPSAASGSASGGTELVTDLLKLCTNLVEKLSGEGSTTNTSGISLHDTDISFDGAGRNSETSADSTDCG